jgi:hypothetical protein
VKNIYGLRGSQCVGRLPFIDGDSKNLVAQIESLPKKSHFEPKRLGFYDPTSCYSIAMKGNADNET